MSCANEQFIPLVRFNFICCADMDERKCDKKQSSGKVKEDKERRSTSSCCVMCGVMSCDMAGQVVLV